MKLKIITGLTIVAGISAASCGKKKSSSTDTTTAASGTTTTTTAAAGSVVSVSSLALVPDADTFLKSTSTSLADSLALEDRGDGYSLVTGTPPNFTDIAGSLAKYLTDDVSTLSTAIATAKGSSDWDSLKSQATKFFDAEAKCGVMEHSAHIIQRLRQDTAPLCLLKAAGAVGDKVYKVVSGDAISDLTQIFVPISTDKILQIGLTDKNQPHYEMVKITGTTTNPNGYHAVYSTCLSSSKKPFRQNIIDVNNTTGIMSFTSTVNGAIDDKGAKPNALFSLKGYIVSDGAGGAVADTSKARSVAYAAAGGFGQLTTTEQGALTITADELKATFFNSETGTDGKGNAATRSDKSVLDVQYSGTGTSDLVIAQGAGRSILTMAGTVGGVAITNTNDHSIGFAFDNTQTPQYTTVTSSTYLTNIASIDFTTDLILKATAPTAPDMTTIDDTGCTATPTTVLNYVDKPEDNTTYAAALASCNVFPAEKSANMCDVLRNVEHDINGALKARKDVKGDTKY